MPPGDPFYPLTHPIYSVKNENREEQECFFSKPGISRHCHEAKVTPKPKNIDHRFGLSGEEGYIFLHLQSVLKRAYHQNSTGSGRNSLNKRPDKFFVLQVG
jgi:hypothetical protein